MDSQLLQNTLPDDDTWIALYEAELAAARDGGPGFTDPQFPPDDTSIFHDPASPTVGSLVGKVTQWRRVGDLFNSKSYLSLTFNDTEKYPNKYPVPNPLSGAGNIKEADYLAALANQPAEDFAPKAELFRGCVEAVINAGIVERDPAATAALSVENFGEWLTANFTPFWDNVTVPMEPAIYKKVGKCAFVPEAKPGFMPTMTVLFPVEFGPPDGTRLFERDVPGKPFVEPGDVRQGCLGDCYVLGALSSMAVNQQLLLDVFPDLPPELTVDDPTSPAGEQRVDESGLFTVRLHTSIGWRIIVMDSWIPCDERGLPVFCKAPAGQCECWAMLAEKAYAKLNGSYEFLTGGSEAEALQDFMGGAPLRKRIQQLEPEAYWASLNRDMQGGATVCCSMQGGGTEELHPMGIMSGHAYGILNVCEVQVGGETERLMHIRNPWGGGAEWTGAWGDNDPRWMSEMTAEQREQLEYRDAEDGTWWMNYHDWRATFTVVEWCMPLHEYTKNSVLGMWDGEGTGGYTKLHVSPQYKLTLGPGTPKEGEAGAAEGGSTQKVYLELRQCNRRAKGERNYSTRISPLLFKAGPLAPNNLISKPEFHMERACILGPIEVPCDGEQTELTVVATTRTEVAAGTAFALTVFTEGFSTLEPVGDTAPEPPHACFNGSQGIMPPAPPS